MIEEWYKIDHSVGKDLVSVVVLTGLLKMGQSRSLFIYFRLFHIIQFKKLMKAWCCVNASYTYHNIYSLFCQSSTDFSVFLLPSRLFHSLPLASIYIIFAASIPRNVPDSSHFYDVLPTYYIWFENVLCSYINLINSKYSISSLKAFVHCVAAIHKTN